MSTVLVTGGTGFVGHHAARILAERGWQVRLALRKEEPVPGGMTAIPVGEIDGATRWERALDGADSILHLAAVAHLQTSGQEIRRVNLEGTAALAEAAQRAGVRRLVFASSVKVLGERTAARPFVESDVSGPEDAYGRAKRDAEQALRRVADGSPLEIAIVRAPLVHGPGVKGNLARLMAVVKRGVPLPLGAVDNRRSLIGVGNLVDMLTLCLDHPAAAGETFLAADERDVSTPELIGLLARGLGVRARLFPLPVPALRLAGRLVGRQDEVDRLCCSLQVDAAKARRLLGWSPRLSLEEGLANMTTWYLDQARV